MDFFYQEKDFFVTTYWDFKDLSFDQCKPLDNQQIFMAAAGNDADVLDRLVPDYKTCIRQSFQHKEIICGACWGNQVTLLELEYQLYSRINCPFPLGQAILYALKADNTDILDCLVDFHFKSLPVFTPADYYLIFRTTLKKNRNTLLNAKRVTYENIMQKLIDMIPWPSTCLSPDDGHLSSKFKDSSTCCCMEDIIYCWDHNCELLCMACESTSLHWVRYFCSWYSKIHFQCLKFSLRNDAIEVFQYILDTIQQQYQEDQEIVYLGQYLDQALLFDNNLPVLTYLLKNTNYCQRLVPRLGPASIGWLLNHHCFQVTDKDYQRRFSKPLKDRAERHEGLSHIYRFVMPKDIITTLQPFVGFEPSDWTKGQSFNPLLFSCYMGMNR